MAGDGQERTEAPTPKRLKEARQEGRTAKTPDLSAWAVVVAAASALPGVVADGAQRLGDRLRVLPAVVSDPEPERALASLRLAAGDVVALVAPVAAAAFVAAVVAAYLQGGLHLATKAAKPQLKHLSPLQGAKRVFGPMAWWEGAKVLLKVVVLAVSMYLVVGDVAPLLATSGSLPLSASVESARGAATQLLLTAAVAGVAVAGADYAVSRRRLMKQLRMTLREVKEEHKQSEGDPALKGAIRQRQLAVSRNRMMAEIATADVVLVNPTHVAVALRYDPGRGAPRVVAKGAGAVAARIREEAAEHRVPMVEDVPLARALHAACEVGQEVPPAVYAAVARVLAFVMSLRAKGSAAGTHRVPGPALPVEPLPRQRRRRSPAQVSAAGADGGASG